KSHHYFSAQHVVNRFSAKELAQIFFKYGEERHSRRIAQAICERRDETPFKTTKQLAQLITELVPATPGRRIHPATRVFQAIRIFVNKELDNIELFMKNILSFIKPGGHLACISFHSLEDRLVKSFIRDNEVHLSAVTRKPIIPTEEEILVNPPSRSAKLRIAAKKG
ncbi:MAG: 16S rRNA (cytosine(1402)-N(4))-methyltransferase RsmH, partial [Candidatus Dependentiae bacterium]